MFTCSKTEKILKIMQDNGFLITINISDILHLTEYLRMKSMGDDTKYCLIVTRQGRDIKTKSTFNEINDLIYK